jgi:AcrR family transcriptional regulator
VVLREVARRVGVSPTAAYRHFENQQALQNEVKKAALGELAQHMQAAIAALPVRSDEPARDAAARRLVAIGQAYFAFAIDNEGLFRCFCEGMPTSEEVPWDVDEAAFGVLSQTMDELIGVGETALLPRPGADLAAWSAIHGLAMLCLDGPLAALPLSEKQSLCALTAGMVLHGLLGPGLRDPAASSGP